MLGVGRGCSSRGMFRTSCPPDAEWVASSWDLGWFACKVMSLKLALGRSPPCSWGNSRVCTEAAPLGQADACVPRCRPVIAYSNRAWTLPPHRATADLPMQLSLNPNPAPMGAKAVFSRLCGSCCDASADPPHGTLTGST